MGHTPGVRGSSLVPVFDAFPNVIAAVPGLLAGENPNHEHTLLHRVL